MLTLEDAFLDELLSRRAALELRVKCVLGGGHDRQSGDQEFFCIM